MPLKKKKTVKKSAPKKKATKVIAKKAVKKPVKKAASKVVKKPVKKAIKKPVKKVAKKPVKKAVKKVVKKVAKKPVKKLAKKPVKKVAKKVVKKTVNKTDAKKVKVSKTPVVKKQKQSSSKKVVNTKNVVKEKQSLKATTVQQTSSFRENSQKEPKPVKKENMIKHTESEVLAVEAPQKAKTLLGALEFMPYQPGPDEEYMTEKQRDHFRGILMAWKQQLMQDVDLTVGHLKEDAVFYADPVDRASQEEGFNLELRTRDRERKLIKKIEQSLDLINSNDYGFCEDCGTEIGIRRLEARPTAVKCIDCKTFQEIREKQLGG